MTFFFLFIIFMIGCNSSKVVIVVETEQSCLTADFEPSVFKSKVVERLLKGSLDIPGKKVEVSVERRTTSFVGKTKVSPIKHVTYVVMPSTGFGPKVFRFFENDTEGDCVTKNSPTELAQEIELEFSTLFDVVSVGGE